MRRADVQALADELLSEGLTPGTVSNVLNPVQALYRRLIDRDALAHNPASRLDLPAKCNARPKRIASGAEAAELLAVLPDEDQPVWATAFYAGLRRGELQGLREGAIEPKSGASERSVPLLAVLRDYLDEHLLRTGREGKALVFGRTAEAPFVPSSIDNRPQECWGAAELEPITLHEARHTFASLLIDSGANAKTVQEFHGALEDPDDLRYLRAPAPRLSR